jgi:hypothetical protein
MNHQEICDKIIGQVIEGVEIDYDDEVFILHTDKGFIEFSGDGLAMYVEDKIKN